jgi:hypothetical protein
VNPAAIFWPVLALVALTFVVSIVMYRRRIREITAKKIRLAAVALSAGMAAHVEDTRASDNYRNLYEGPVLFYVAALAAFALKVVTPAILLLAWLYVACRIVHTVIHCTTNRVRHRFYAFFASHIVLFALWVVLAASIVTWTP